VSRRSALVLAALFAALAGLVAAGSFAGLDQWAVDHAMPGGRFHARRTRLVDSLLPLGGSHWHGGWAIAVNLVALPAGAVVSLAILALLRQWLLAAICVAADLVELLCKHTLTRPALYTGRSHIAPFDSSFPSGHALRTVIVAAAVAAWRPRASPLAAVWACASVALLLLAGWHTPTDLAGGLLLGALALLGLRGARALRARRLRA
jgi:membrane-associated phospholipid phosphatase